MHYLDRQLCEAKNCTHFETCYRALTPERLDASEKWWDDCGRPWEPTPIDYFYFKDKDCYNPKMDK